MTEINTSKIQPIVSTLRLAQNLIAAKRDMCDEDEGRLWDRYEDAIKEVHNLNRYVAPIWESGQNLQIDSYATGQRLIHSYIRDDCIRLDLTNGDTTWQGVVPLPEKWVRIKS